MKLDRSLELFDEALKVIPGGSQTVSKRPQAFAYGAFPIYVAEADGCRVTDVDGNTYIDFISALGPIILGYNHPAVQEAVAAQLHKGILSGLLFEVEVEAAKIMTEMIPGAEMVRFFKGGGEGTAAAARVARAFTGKELILNAGYRGWPDVWAVQHDPAVPQGLKSSIKSFPSGNIEALEKLLQEHTGEVAAVFLDVGPGGNPDPDYLPQVQELAHRHGALFCMDEIVTGFRVAPGGAQEYFKVKPDLSVFAKGMANGMPVSALVGRVEVMRTLERISISITYGGEALSLAGAIATMNEIREKAVPDHLWKIGRMLWDGLEKAAAENEIPFQCKGLAPVQTMAFGELSPAESKQVWGFFLQEMAARGVLMRRGGVNFVMQSHTEEDVAFVVKAAKDVFAELRQVWKTPELEKRLKIKEVNTGFRSFA